MRMPPHLVFLPLLAAGCSDGSLNLFTIQDDIDLGRQLRDEILNDPATYPVVDEADAAEAYDYLYMLRDEILDTNELQYTDDFDWEIYLIDDDDTLKIESIDQFGQMGAEPVVHIGPILLLWRC